MINTVQHGDCLQIMPDMADGSVEMVLTDIPYDVVSRPSGGLRNLDKGSADIATFSIQDFIPEVVRVIRGSVYIFCSTEQVSEIRARLIDEGLTTRLCVWQKTNPSPMNGQYMWLSGIETCVYGRKKGAIFNEHCQNPVWQYPTQRKIGAITPKPVALFERLIQASSNTGDIVLDPCMGVGTACAAAIRTGRHYIGMDINKACCKYAKIWIKQLESQTKLFDF